MRLIDKDAIHWDVEGVGEIPVITKEEVDEMPTVEAVPVRYAKLLNAHPYGECSNCGYLIDIREEFNYCPNCGAKMERKEE